MSKYRLHILILICMVLGVFVWLDNQATIYEIVSPGKNKDRQSLTTKTTSINPVTLDNPLKALKKEELQDTLNRPLFSEDRSPPEKPQKRVVRQKKKPVKPKRVYPNYALIGVVLDGARSIALLRRKTNGISIRVQQGDSVEGWKLVSVDSNSITLQQEDGEKIKVQLFKN